MPLPEKGKRKTKTARKEQKLREAEERKIKTRKDEVAREVSTSKEVVVNNMKLWYLRNYTERFPLIKEEMDIAWHSFEHTMDVKDFIICQLQDRLDEAKLQEAMAWQDYVIKVDNIIDDYNLRVENMDRHFQDLLKQKMEDAMVEAQKQEAAITDLEDYYKIVLYIMEEQFKDSSTAAQGGYMTKRDEEAKRGVHLTEMMSAALEKTVKRTAEGIKEYLQEYREATESMRREVDLLRDKDSYYLDIIQKQDVRVAKLCDEMSSLQSQVNEGYESRLLLEDLKKDREETHSEYMHVRASLNQTSKLDATQLLTLTTHSKDTIKHLEHVLIKGEKILRLGALCRNLETQEEKVVPFKMSYVKLEDLTVPEIDDYSPFVLFWRKFSRVKLIKRKLEHTLRMFQEENKHLKRQLQNVMEILSHSQVKM